MPDCFYYRHFAADPFFNMAFDESMLELVLRRPASILMRFYTWKEGTITIGLNQEVDRALRLSDLGSTPLIRRVTGGRAVFHDSSEMTYAVALNAEATNLQNWAGPVSQVHLRLAEGLRDFLRATGVTSELVARSAQPAEPLVGVSRKPCFASAARYELMADGAKVVASAQRQVGSSLLQHGSIKLSGIAAHPALKAIGNSHPEPQSLERPQFENLAEQMCRAMGTVFGCAPQMAPSTLLPDHVWRNRLDLVQSDPLARRDTFEQS